MPTIETDLGSILERIERKIDTNQSKTDEALKRIEVAQAEIKGDIKANYEKLSGQINTLDEKASGIGKRLDNQEFLSRGILGGVALALLVGAASFFGLIPSR
jgi:archaellum component FlaC